MTQPSAVTVRVPATSANLGPGFDCLAIALDLWNEMTFELRPGGVQVTTSGEGSDWLYNDHRSMLWQAVLHYHKQAGTPPPAGMAITCHNNIPLGSGCGSSASARLAGLLAADVLSGGRVGQPALLRLATELEGHPDNAAAALYGGLLIVSADDNECITHRTDLPEMQVVVVVPNFHLPTQKAREALPQKISLKDAVFNVGRTALVVEALRSGDFSLLGSALRDRLHQPYRLPLIPGARQAIDAAMQSGAIAAGLSGAGPGVIAFARADHEAVGQSMVAAFSAAALTARSWVVNVSNRGAEIRVNA